MVVRPTQAGSGELIDQRKVQVVKRARTIEKLYDIEEEPR